MDTAANPVSTEGKPPRPKRAIPLSLRGFIVINAAIALIGIVSFWWVILRPMQNHSRAYHRLSDSVESLARRRPPGVSRNQWSYIIGWTMNGIGNCCSVEGFLNRDAESHERFRTLPDRFEERLRGEVTLETIDWLWDELTLISKYGTRYSEQYRPTTPEHLAEADYVSNGIVVP
jgi:hypothetical protein